MIGLKLGKYLTTQSTNAALQAVQNRLSDRIYINRKPQPNTQLPNSIITVIGGNPEYSLTGPIADLHKIVQVDVDATTEYEATEIADLIRAAIEFSPTVPLNQTWDGTTVYSCTVQSERDQSFPPKDASDQWIFRRQIEYQVTYVR